MKVAQRVSQSAFGLLLFLLLASRASAMGGPFTWMLLPLPTAVFVQGWGIGVLSLLPLLVVVCWWLGMISQMNGQNKENYLPQRHKRRGGFLFGESKLSVFFARLRFAFWSFSWGETAVTIPLAAFSLLVLLRLTVETAHLAAMLGLCWLVYLFLVNNPGWQSDWLWRVLAAVLLVQAVVAVAQFLLQRQLGLAWLGEPMLDLLVEGTSVAQHDGQNWLRAYGLNSHPNQLGLLMMALCLLIWPNRQRVNGAWRWLFWLGLAAGVAGLLVSLSRSALLGVLLGSLVFGLQRRTLGTQLRRELVWPLAIMAAGVLLFALVYGDVLAGRLLALDSPLESRSLWERQRDLGVAWQILGERPFLGIGLGQYVAKAIAINPDALMVHNVPLLIGAELGLLGLAIWLLFWGWPLWRYGRSATHQAGTAVWLALILMALLHPEPSLFLPKGAVLWGLAAAQWHVSDAERVAIGKKNQRLRRFSGLSLFSLCNSGFLPSRSYL